MNNDNNNAKSGSKDDLESRKALELVLDLMVKVLDLDMRIVNKTEKVQ